MCSSDESVEARSPEMNPENGFLEEDSMGKIASTLGQVHLNGSLTPPTIVESSASCSSYSQNDAFYNADK